MLKPDCDEFGGFVMKKRKNKNIFKKVSPLRFFCDIIISAVKFLGKDSYCMQCEAISLLKQIYGAASIPVAVADEKLDILWKNSAADASDMFGEKSADFIFPDGEITDGVLSVCVNGIFQQFNVIKYSTEKTCYIIEYTGQKTEFDISMMKSYFLHLCARLRESAGRIAMSADDISLAVKSGSTEVAAELNRIERSIMLLLKEAIIPEQIYYILNPYCKDTTVNLADEIKLAAEDAEAALGRGAEVWQNSEGNIAADINRSVLEALLAYMTAESCCGELFPERLEYSLERKDEGRASVSVRSVNLSGKKNVPSSIAVLKQTESFTDVLFKKLLEEKYGASVEKEIFSDGIECRVTLDVLEDKPVIVKSGSKFAIREKRFSAMAVSLSETHCGERYNNIKINV